MTTDNAFSKAWKKPCNICVSDTPNLRLFFREMCHECYIAVHKEVLSYIKDSKTHAS